MRRVSIFVAGVVLWAGVARAGDCGQGEFASTFALIQKAIFENHGCADDLCHGSAKSGGLDLREGASYASLVDVDAQSVPAWKRVVAGQKDKSLLWANLSAKAQPDLWPPAPLRAMPPDALAPLSDDELEAMRLWIEKGAPKEGVIPGTDTLLDACLPPPGPLEAKPLPPPAPGTGVQIKMPRWILDAHTEHEVCFASYYDITDQVPAAYRGPSGTTFRFKRNQLRQDPLSHHLIVNLYLGAEPHTSPDWGAFKCRGGARDGQACIPTELDACGADSGCATDVVEGVACINFGPPDSGIGLSSAGISGTQETGYEFNYAEGVYAELPLRGMILWNSHAFNLTDKAGKLEAWLNFDFAAPDEQQIPAQGIFDTSHIFDMNAAAFGTDEVCTHFVFPANAHLYEISSHMHQRGKRFRIFDAAWRCGGGPRKGQACSPFGPDFASRDLCAGAECVSLEREQVGDCDQDGSVRVNELVMGVNIALETASVDACGDMDGNRDGRVTVNELVVAIGALINGVPDPTPRDPENSLMYVSQIYNDPVILRMDPPMVFPRAPAGSDDLLLTYCALYDNGFSDPTTVKRRATSPPAPEGFSALGGPCRVPTGCTAGKVGEACSGNSEQARNASCDSRAGEGDGICDACPLVGGVTTEDEMFVLLGDYYVP